ncbi:glycosyltransferase family 2 protein [Halorubrum sp. Ea8]|uniref:glycosyltransferase family 2 protein n=1 Tax=Halorubrum sp. Ea8 TaxID=1383841 RepID=UPI000B9939C4|nr:glycosyltransferase family 2 protein [Halorubrum sp. Ea8]OYR44597.1 glycosyl transferase [Halorubrum sp. Ea8]
MSTGPSTDESQPLVSVVIPTYNRSEYLSDAVESVVEQTYDSIELFIVDDGSPEPVAETLTDCDLDRLDSVTFVRHNENRGANVARNNGIRASKGKYVAFLDDDDRWHETKISRQVEMFESSAPEVGVVYTGKRTDSPSGTTVTAPTAEGDVVEELLKGTNFGQFSSIMVAADAIDAAGLPDERFPAWQDREWFFRLAKHCHFKPVQETLTFRRGGAPGNITSNFEAKRDVAYPLFIDKHYAFAREHGLYLARMFLASMRRNLARSAIRAGRYREARKYFVWAFLANPLFRPVHPHLVASLGGKWTYESASLLRRTAKKL